MRLFFIFPFLISVSTFAQQNNNTISVKKTVTPSEVRLDSAFSKLVVYDQLHTELDSCIVSFEMIVEVPVPNIFYGAPGGPIYKVSTPVTYKNNCGYLSPEMKTAWKKNPKGKAVKFQHIYVKVGNQKQMKLRDFSVKKP